MCDSEFTYDWYERLINLIHDSNYTITNYHEYMKYDKPCILRHDVDMDIIKAAEFASFESKFLSGDGYKGSTYFVLLCCDFYNIFSKNSLEAAYKILSLGNEIGLHFDETKYHVNDDKKQLAEFIEEELHILGQALGTTVRAVSMHRPSKFTLESNVLLKNAVNSYSHEFFKDFKYISDSRMHWREDVCSIVKNCESNKLHILTHPFWYNIFNESTKQKIQSFIHRANIERYEDFSNNFRDLDEFVRLEDVQ